MKKVQLVVFDMAGTTVRDRGNVANAFIEACKEYGIDMPLEEVKKVMGFRKIDAIRMLLEKTELSDGIAKEELIETIHDAFTKKMIRFYETDTELSPLPHAEETFSWLKEQGVKIALNTGFTRAITDAILNRLQWKNSPSIDFVITSDEVPEGRPEPYMIQEIMKKLQVADAGSVVKIGDTEVDVKEGRSAGCGLVVSVTTGAYTRTQLEQYHPDKIIDSLAELPSLIQ